MKRGLLLTLTEPPPAMEEEFNAWYDEEHLPERLAIPGFRSARRWISDRTYLATYELDSPDVLQSAAYLARYQNQTPWSKRCLGKTVAFKRWACEQVEPGEADPHPAATGLIFTMKPAKFSGSTSIEAFRRRFGRVHRAVRARRPSSNSPARVYRLYKS